MRSNTNCPAEFETKITVNPLSLVGAGGVIWVLASIIAFAALKPFLPAKEWADVYAAVAKFISAMCLAYFAKEVGINISAVLRDWWRNRARHLQIVIRYFLVYAGFLLLILGALAVALISLEKTGLIAPALIDLAGNTELNGKMAQLRVIMERSIPRFAISLLSMCVLAPVIEEVYFRRFLFVSLRKKVNFVPALLISSILFMAVHPNLALGAVGGIYLGYIYEKGKSLPANILIHSVVNFITITIGIVLSSLD